MQSLYKFKITLKQQLLVLCPILLLYFILIIGWSFFLKMSLTSSSFIILLIIVFLIDTLPTLIVNVQYLRNNYYCELSIFCDLKKLSLKCKNELREYSLDEIRSLQYFVSYANGTGWHSFGQYRYYKIEFNDNSSIIVTCLLVNDIEKVIPMLLNKNEEKHMKIIAFIQK